MPEIWAWSLGWEDPLEKKWQPIPVFLPGKSHGQRSLVGHSPRGRRVRRDWVAERKHTHREHHTSFPFTCRWMHVWVLVSLFWLLWIILLWIFVTPCFQFFRSASRNRIAGLFGKSMLIFWETIKPFSTAAIPFYILKLKLTLLLNSLSVRKTNLPVKAT